MGLQQLKTKEQHQRKNVFAPFTVGDKFYIVPAGVVIPSNDKIVIELIRGKAFGTGEHETTFSCLNILQQIPDLSGMKILDFGSGTGILGIAALKLGADLAWALDLCGDAFNVCQANAIINGVEGRLRRIWGDLGILNGRKFDLILANVYSDILLTEAEALVNKMSPNSQLVLSGIAFEYLYDVKTFYQRLGLTLINTFILSDYITLRFAKIE